MKRGGIVAAGLAAVALVAPLGAVAMAPALFAQASTGAGVCVADVDGPIAGFADEQLDNAAAIISAANEHDMGLRGAQIGVMTAIEESTLRNIAYGDGAINPDGTVADSIGLFQQQSSWGSVDERMDPATSASLFFARLATLPGWQGLAPEDAAHAIQVNDRADRYAEHWDDAVAIVAGLTGGASCATSGTLTADGWSAPTGDPVTSEYGWRVDPISGGRKFHNGVDFSGGCGAPIYAVASGTVSDVFKDTYGAWIVEVDHGGGYATWYVHMEDAGVLVGIGDVVAGGQQIGLQGSSGYSTGCHLHFEAHFDGNPIDPVAWLAEHGVILQ